MLPRLVTIVFLPLITDIKFLVPLKYNSRAELSKGWKKTNHLEWPTDGAYSRIPDEEFTLDATEDIFKPLQNTVKKDLSRLELFNLESSEEHNVNPHLSLLYHRATNSQKNIAIRCKDFLTRTESKSQCKDRANENDLLESLCKIYLRQSMNGLNRNKIFTSESPDGLGISGAGKDDPINSFLSGILWAGSKGKNGFLGDFGVNSFAGEGRNIGKVRADGREVFGERHKGLADNLGLESDDKFKESGKAVHLVTTSAGLDNPINATGQDLYRCLVEALLKPKQGGEIGDLFLKSFNLNNVGDKPRRSCLHLLNLKNAQDGMAASRVASLSTVGRFRPLAGRRFDWVAMGGNAKDNRKPLLVV